jgi:hypothetical protein
MTFTVPNGLLELRFGDDSDVPRVFVPNLIFTIGPQTREYPVFDMVDFNAGKRRSYSSAPRT